MATAANAKASTTWRARVGARRESGGGAERSAGGIRAAAYRARALAQDTAETRGGPRSARLRLAARPLRGLARGCARRLAAASDTFRSPPPRHVRPVRREEAR